EMRLYWNNKPAGALSDLNVVLLPRFPTHLTLGVNSLGFNPTYNVLVNMRSSPNLQYSFGVLNSNLGVRTRLTGLGPFGLDARLYNTRQPQLDLYGDLRLAMRLRLFYGEKALMGPAANRTPQFGLQFGY
ncbi:MAG TPA: hypothetical protein VGQ96_01345, partial [Candidatus Eremiobacteraceae bacterium]|nr:hypothetical protein [Candidatus Eremiobacteraceae bacterium]